MTDIDIAVVGGGLAGLSAALQAARLGRRCSAFTGAVAGGALLSIESIQGLPGHPDGIAGYELGPMTQEQAMDAGADCRAEEAASVERDGDAWLVRGADTGDVVRARALVLAPGSTLRTLGIDGEARLHGKGVSHCASCDAPLLRGKAVAVVGGGDSACQEALTLAAHAAQVTLLVRGERLRAQASWRQRIDAQRNVACRHATLVEAIVGDDVVRAVRVRGADGAPSELAVDAVFVYVGLQPATGFVAGAVPLDADGRLVVDASLRTPVRGAFAAGNARAGSCGQAAAAAADGIAAAWAAHRFLDDGVWPG